VEINPQEEAGTSVLEEATALAIPAVVAIEPEIAQADPIARDSPLRIGGYTFSQYSNRLSIS
jgi:hypothetical protein